MEAELVAYRWKTVTLKAKNGKEVQLSIEKLSGEDQTFLKTKVPVVVIPGDGGLAGGGIVGNGFKRYSNDGFPPIERIDPAGEGV